MTPIPQSESNVVNLLGRSSQLFSGPPDTRRLFHYLTLAGVAVVYFFAAKLGLSLAFINASVSPVWPPTGVAMAAVLLLGYRIWPGILLGAFLANFLTPVPIATAGGIAIGNTLEALSAGLVLRSLGFHNSLDRARDVLNFVLAAVFCTMVAATIGNLSLCLGHAASWSEFGSLWMTWWLGDTVGGLTVAPLLLTWGTESSRRWSTKRYVEAVILLALLSAASMATFGGPSPIPLRWYPLSRLLVPFFLVITFRLGQRGVSLASITISLFAIWGTSHGVGPFVGRTLNDSLLVLQVFLGSNVVMFMFLAAAVEERRRATETLHENERRLAANLAITRILAESPALGDATSRILQRVGETLAWQVGAMWTPDTGAKVLRCLNVWHAPSDRVEEFKAVCLNRTFTRGVGLPGRVWTGLKPVWIPDVTKDENFPRAPYAVSAGLHSAFAFPIMFGDRFLGVMEFFSHDIRKPDDALLVTLGTVGNQIGQFIERKRGEEEREHLLAREHIARAEAESANRTKDEFLAIVSHELRTPLNAILGWSAMLRGGSLDEKTTDRAIEVIDRNAKVQAQLIEDILDVSRIVSGNLRLDLRPVTLQQVIETAIDSVRPTTESKNIRVQMVLDPQAGPVSGDPDRLQQVVWNLLSNAVKFTPSEGQISVQLVNVNSHVEIVISDTGQGIAAEFLPHIFDPFRQADGSKTRRHGGLGLGLAIARHLVELHGGAVKAQSDGEGRGTTFTITLPCVGVAPLLSLRKQRTDLGRASRDRSGELTGLRVLSVEDDADSREMLEMALRAEGADVISVGSVREALHVLNGNEWRPAVMVSDIGMPDEDGYDLIRELRSRTPEQGGNLPAIALTGFAGNGERERALSAGYQMHLTKPVEWSNLIQTIAVFARDGSS